MSGTAWKTRVRRVDKLGEFAVDLSACTRFPILDGPPDHICLYHDLAADRWIRFDGRWCQTTRGSPILTGESWDEITRDQAAGLFRARGFSLPTELDEASAPVDTGGEDLVTLDQAAGMVHRSKRTLERLKTSGELPEPTVEGGGGRPDLWAWRVIRPWLAGKYGIRLSESFPAKRRG